MKTVLLTSGGLDSAVALYQLRQQGHDVRCLSFDYGQRHRRELESAEDLCVGLNVPHKKIDLTAIQPLIGSSALTGHGEIPDGHYAEESMKATVVPNRNMIFFSIAIGWAISEKCDAVTYAAHSGDHTIYPDCRPEFAEALDRCAKLCDWHPIHVHRPFINVSKAEIVRLGHELRVPFEKTWSCYKGMSKHCGTCGTCVERREAFTLAKVKDPTEYAS